ncbi:hypothetical protein K432DRAFT_135651 [Lepidopterella palustris CBS 459.81]|uniref:Uncharacterized protein n=1 Tax=Lepidopterella palustris CBS 459.81 TaxID=1314670 RepID=A0A8E2E441_9PEZI|nr:hypothetical protein K432DRAFT_135651 [Lepidopterella palustris CBS 459.81]
MAFGNRNETNGEHVYGYFTIMNDILPITCDERAAIVDNGSSLLATREVRDAQLPDDNQLQSVVRYTPCASRSGTEEDNVEQSLEHIAPPVELLSWPLCETDPGLIHTGDKDAQLSENFFFNGLMSSFGIFNGHMLGKSNMSSGDALCDSVLPTQTSYEISPICSHSMCFNRDSDLSSTPSDACSGEPLQSCYHLLLGSTTQYPDQYTTERQLPKPYDTRTYTASIWTDASEWTADFQNTKINDLEELRGPLLFEHLAPETALSEGSVEPDGHK